jgi:hypothetical protein
MLSIPGGKSSYCDGVSRRSFLRIGGLALGGMTLPQLLRAESESGVNRQHKGIIMVLLPGGPPHLDMYDLKPDASAEIRGEFSPIRTSVPGIEICELMPRMAAIMDKLVPIRSLYGAIEDHNMHQCVTGWGSHPQQTSSPAVPGFPPGGWPSLGSVLSKVYGPAVPGVPPTIDLTPVYYDARFVTNTAPGQAGYLGPAHAGFEVAAVQHDDIVLNQVSLDRLSDRKSLISSFDRFRRSVDSSGILNQVDTFTRQAFEVMTSSRLAAALDLSQEDSKLKERYGLGGVRPTGGDLLDQFLIARRIIEAGARCVTLCFARWPFGRMMKGDYNWDWHLNNFKEARVALPMLDIGISALVEDLGQRGLLDDIAVIAWGEFGRTPKINVNAGRDHWPAVGGALLAGGGMRTGQVIGSTDHNGERPQNRPVHFREVFATLYHQFGIDVETAQFPDLAGRPHYLVDERKPMPELI